MRVVTSKRTPKGDPGHLCASCGKVFRFAYNGRSTEQVVFQLTYTDRGEWRKTELFHPRCFESQ